MSTPAAPTRSPLKRLGRIASRLLVMGLFLAIPFLLRSSDSALGERVNDLMRPALCLVSTQHEPVNAVGADAVGTTAPADEAHPPRHAVDANPNTWWGQPSPDGGTPALDVLLPADGVVVSRVAVLPGEANEGGGDYLGQPRPRTVTLELLDGTTPLASTTVDLEDSHEVQAFPLGAETPATVVRVTVDAVHPGQDGDSVAIAEVRVDRDACG